MNGVQNTNDAANTMTVGQLLEGVAHHSSLVDLIAQVNRNVASLRAELAERRQTPADSDGWLDAKAAAEYLSLSRGAFDKYRYETTPRIVGSSLDGKVLYKKADLDSFVRLYSLKSMGRA